MVESGGELGWLTWPDQNGVSNRFNMNAPYICSKTVMDVYPDSVLFLQGCVKH